MDECKIKIASCGGGLNTEIRTVGEMCEADGTVIFRYKLEGDDCTLTVKDGTVSQIRSGRQSVFMVFSEGTITEGNTGDGYLICPLEVYTRKISFKCGKGGFRLTLLYT